MVTKVTELAIYNVICLCILKYSTNFSFVIIENYALLLTLWLSMLSGFHLGISSWGGKLTDHMAFGHSEGNVPPLVQTTM